MSKYLADTMVLIDHLRGDDRARLFLAKSELSISVVTIAELIQGSRDSKDLALVSQLCSNFSELAINKKISSRAIELMEKFNLSHGLMFLDSLIAATAIENKLILVTGNLKHFKFIAGLEVEDQKLILNDLS